MEADLVLSRIATRDDDVDFVTDFDHFARMFDFFERDVGGVAQAINAWFKFDERSERLKPGNLALVT